MFTIRCLMISGKLCKYLCRVDRNITLENDGHFPIILWWNNKALEMYNTQKELYYLKMTWGINCVGECALKSCTFVSDLSMIVEFAYFYLIGSSKFKFVLLLRHKWVSIKVKIIQNKFYIVPPPYKTYICLLKHHGKNLIFICLPFNPR